ncbi:MAG: MFS transporter [Anaerolineae bacterium]
MKGGGHQRYLPERLGENQDEAVVDTRSGASANAAQAFLERNQGWNFAVNVANMSLFNLAMSFIYGSTVLSLYASYLTDSAVLIGLIPAVQNAMFFIPQLLLARHVQTLPRIKPFVTRLSLGERLPYGIVALTILLWPGAPRWAAYAILALSLTLAMGAGGVSNPAWKKMIAKVVPVRRRGLLFGTSNALGGLMGVGGAALSRYVFARWEYPYTFGISFLLCFAAQMASWAILNLNREPTVEVQSQALESREYWRRLPQLLRQDRNFSRFLISRTLAMLGTMGMAFYVVYARDAFQVSDVFVASLTMAALISQTVSTPLLGLIADWRGHKLLMELSGLFLVAAILTIIAAPQANWLYVVFVLVNVSMASGMIAGMAITMEFGPPEEMPTYSALASTVQALPILLAPLIGGWLVDWLGFQAMFITAVAFSLAGVLYMRLFVRDPRHEAPASPLAGGAKD